MIPSKIVIVCGMPRSSTSMVQEHVNSHGEIMVSVVCALYAESYRHFRAIEDQDPKGVLTVQVDRVGSEIGERLVFCQCLLEFLDQKMSEGMRRFVQRWPVIDYWAADRVSNHTAPRQVADFCRDPVVREFSDRFGYELPYNSAPPPS
jgi:hypothetical protein